MPTPHIPLAYRWSAVFVGLALQGCGTISEVHSDPAPYHVIEGTGQTQLYAVTIVQNYAQTLRILNETPLGEGDILGAMSLRHRASISRYLDGRPGSIQQVVYIDLPNIPSDLPIWVIGISPLTVAIGSDPLPLPHPVETNEPTSPYDGFVGMRNENHRMIKVADLDRKVSDIVVINQTGPDGIERTHLPFAQTLREALSTIQQLREKK